MPFFQNPFSEDFEGNWLLGDRHHIPKFVLKSNTGRGKDIVASWKAGPYNLSGNDGAGNARKYLNIVYSLHNPKNWATMQVDVTAGAGSASAVKPQEIVAALQANTLFAERFTADYGSFNDNTSGVIKIRQKKPTTEFRFYIANGQAEAYIGFNARAGVAELPTYFAMHTIANRFNFPASEGRIIQLDDTAPIDQAVIDGAVDFKGNSLGYSHSTIRADWQLLRGRSGIFTFTKGPSTNSVSATETTISYPAGAIAGDLAEKTVVQKDSSGVIVATFQMPYTLASGDLVSPP